MGFSMKDKPPDFAEMIKAIKRVRELHSETDLGGCSDEDCCSPFDSELICSECYDVYPCKTIKALDGE